MTKHSLIKMKSEIQISSKKFHFSSNLKQKTCLQQVAWIPIGLEEWNRYRIKDDSGWRDHQEFRIMFISIFGAAGLACMLPTVFMHSCHKKNCIYNRLVSYHKVRFKWALLLLGAADIFHMLIFFHGLMPLIIFDSAEDGWDISKVESLSWVWAGLWLVHQVMLEIVFWGLVYYNSRVWRFEDENGVQELDEFEETCCGCRCGGNEGCCGCFGN